MAKVEVITRWEIGTERLIIVVSRRQSSLGTMSTVVTTIYKSALLMQVFRVQNILEVLRVTGPLDYKSHLPTTHAG